MEPLPWDHMWQTAQGIWTTWDDGTIWNNQRYLFGLQRCIRPFTGRGGSLARVSSMTSTRPTTWQRVHGSNDRDAPLPYPGRTTLFTRDANVISIAKPSTLKSNVSGTVPWRNVHLPCKSRRIDRRTNVVIDLSIQSCSASALSLSPERCRFNQKYISPRTQRFMRTASIRNAFQVFRKLDKFAVKRAATAENWCLMWRESIWDALLSYLERRKID